MTKEALQTAANEARGLAIDAVHACQSGHLGLPLGSAEIGAVLFGRALSFNPAEPQWFNRDRFVLSAGHGSMFLYGWLHLAGFDISLQDVKDFRKLHSKTPGHPEFHETPGVEATTGPLGQGVSNAVGIAIAAKMAAAQFNTAEHTIIDHAVVTLAGDGCLQEGVAAEAMSLAAHLGLDNLIVFFDSNDVTLDAMADQTQSEDHAARFAAYGFEVQTVDGQDIDAVSAAYATAREGRNNGKPKFIICRTLIGKGIPEVQGTQKAHGEGGHKFFEAARKGLGLPEELFFVSEGTRAFFAERKQQHEQAYAAWTRKFAEWRSANPEKAALYDSIGKRPSAESLLEMIPAFDTKDAIATRKAGQVVLQPLAKNLPFLVSGSADLHGSTLNYLDCSGDFSRSNPTGRNIRYGIREHAMGAIVNGFGYHGQYIASGATFATFSDYMRGSLRLAALSSLNVFHIFTHDSVGVGEDGPTHQPVEINAALRAIPNMNVIRPADPEETAGAFAAAISRTDGPTSLILTRQNVPHLTSISVEDRRNGVSKGAYIAKKETDELNAIIIATGSEVHVALAAADKIGAGVRVVSMPCMENFERQTADYKESVLPRSCRRRVSVEAGVSQPFYRYIGLDGAAVSLERFGLSCPGGQVLKELGIHADAVVAAVSGL